jgi:hypothetical protein
MKKVRNEEQIKHGESFVPFGSESLVFSPPVQTVNIKIHKTAILPVVLYGYETWSLILREEHELRVFGNRAFVPKRDEATGDWRKLHHSSL